ncbi:hypothetical protein BDW69DRAFT_189190 [Aspergillus filifer]
MPTFKYIASAYLSWRKSLLSSKISTIWDNILPGNILPGIDASTMTNEQLHAVCRDASIQDFIAALPKSYNTDIGLLSPVDKNNALQLLEL